MFKMSAFSVETDDASTRRWRGSQQAINDNQRHIYYVISNTFF